MLRRIFLVLPAIGLFATVASAAETVGVKSAALGEIAVYPERTAPATVLSLNQTTVSAEIAATVVNIPVQVGDIVEAGGELMVLECTDYDLAQRRSQATVESLNARIQLATRQLERARQLEQQQSVAVETVDMRVAELAVLEAEKRMAVATVDGTKRNVARCRVKSPFRGLVTERLSALGQLTAVGSPLFTLLDLSAIEVSAQVPSDEVVQIEKADDIRFSFADQRYPLRLRTIVPAINVATRNQEVRLVFADTVAIAGASGKLIWSDYRPHLPANVLVDRDGKLGIFIHHNGTVRFHPLEAAQAGRSTPVDLAEDTQIIIEGQYGLQDNAGVKVNN